MANDKPYFKATNAVVAQRVEEVLRIRLDGAQFHEIREYAVEQGWGVSDTQLRRYIEKSDDLLRDRQEKRVSRRRRLHLARREALYGRALQAADLRTGLAALQDMAKLEGLYESNKGLEKQVADLLAKLSAMEGTTHELPAGRGAGQAPGGGPSSEAAGDGGEPLREVPQ